MQLDWAGAHVVRRYGGPLPSAVPSARSRASVHSMAREGVARRCALGIAAAVCDRPIVSSTMEQNDTTNVKIVSKALFSCFSFLRKEVSLF